MKAVSTLKHGLKRSIKESNSSRQQEVESFHKMLVQVASQPYSQSALEQVMFHSGEVVEDDEEDNQVEDLMLLKHQANSFTPLVSKVDLGE